MRFVPPLRKGENLRKEARRNFVILVCFGLVFLFLSWIRHRHQQWVWICFSIWAPFIAFITVFDIDAYWESRDKPLRITPDRDEALERVNRSSPEAKEQ